MYSINNRKSQGRKKFVELRDLGIKEYLTENQIYILAHNKNKKVKKKKSHDMPWTRGYRNYIIPSLTIIRHKMAGLQLGIQHVI